MIDIKGVLYGIAAALPIFRKQGFGHFVNTASTAGHKTVPNQSVYSGTKFAVRAISEGLRQVKPLLAENTTQAPDAAKLLSVPRSRYRASVKTTSAATNSAAI